MNGVVAWIIEFFSDLLGKTVDFCMSFGAKLIGAGLILLIGFKVSNVIVNALTKSKLFETIDKTAQTFLKSAIAIVLKVIVVISAIGVLGVPLASVVTVVASCGVAVGLALQGGLSNIAGGIIILIFKPFKVGDYIDNGSVNGSVEAIGIFYTTLITPDNKRVIIPNGSLMNSTVTAANQLDTRRVDFEFSVSYSADVDKVRKIIEEAVKANENVLENPNVDIFLSSHADSAIKFAVRVWTKTENYWAVYFDINEKIKKAFDANGIEIPFQQIDVHVKNN